jgi:mono/diheme cytochrome c family protein
MKKISKVIVFTVVALVLIAVIGLGYITMCLPDVGKPEDIKIALTPQRIARGKYLANHVTLCTDCHSQRDWSKRIGEIDPDKLGAGGDNFGSDVGVPGDIYVPNITPFSLKGWTDGEIFRAITTGERKDGTAIFPFMPWQNFAKMDREDLYSIIAYIRTLHPIETKPYPERKLDFPTNIIVHLMPQKAGLGKLPPVSDTIAYGKYLVTAASCTFCHSQSDKGTPLPGLEFAGGVNFKLGGTTVTSANITPDKATGIGNWSREAFLQRFKDVRDTSSTIYKQAAKFKTVMPWYDYAGMNDTDLKAIYAYLRTIKPVSNKVVTW